MLELTTVLGFTSCNEGEFQPAVPAVDFAQTEQVKRLMPETWESEPATFAIR
jgi:hypothetical protein